MNELTYLKLFRIMLDEIERIVNYELWEVKGADNAKGSLVELHYRLSETINALERTVKK